MRPNSRNERQRGLSKMLLIILLVLSLLFGVVGGVVGALFFAKTGPQGEQGIQGSQGLQGIQGIQGTQGVQGEPGINGTQGSPGVPGTNGTNGINSILQILQARSNTAQTTVGYAPLQWFNMSVFDPSMNMSITIRQNSRIFVQFSATLSIEAPGSLWIRILVDNSLNSTLSIVSVGPSPSAGSFKMQSHIEFLTDPLNSGQHSIDVQFYKENGTPVILDRTLTFMEIAA